MVGRIHIRRDPEMDGLINGWMEERINRKVDRWRNGSKERWMDEGTDQ